MIARVSVAFATVDVASAVAAATARPVLTLVLVAVYAVFLTFGIEAVSSEPDLSIPTVSIWSDVIWAQVVLRFASAAASGKRRARGAKLARRRQAIE